ncbi:MAG: hypothetical protein M1818_005621 [Claussenomyces sp. TS43310]|nr:MAG: hypothetical protein M1818_005621 [Claussenomyces sp. TS43310]
MAPEAIIHFQGPMDNLEGYDRSLPAGEQPVHIPVSFLHAMDVREAVFVNEQGVPLDMEADSDDARSCHFVAFDVPSSKDPSKLHAVGTVRLVPFPHEPHPLPGSAWDIPEEIEPLTSDPPRYIIDRATSLHDGKEAYIKLGRWAVVKDFRGRGIAKKLVERAVQWLEDNPAYFNAAVPGVDPSQTHWKGLLCVHAQKHVAKGWEGCGFQLDEKMGEWTEAGIPHVGMFRRIDVSKAATAKTLNLVPGDAATDSEAPRYNH